jgi:FkbM family methyltransferase
VAKARLAMLLGLRRLGLLERLNFIYPVAESGKRVLIPLLAGVGWDNIFMAERWMGGLLRLMLDLRPRGTFVDIGVNVGQTLIKLQRLESGRPYVGFEPNPVCVNYLNVLMRENRFDDAQIVPVGVFDQPALLELLSPDEGDTAAGNASVMRALHRRGRKSAEGQWVALLPFELAAVALGLDEISVIKIDVEGAEVFVLQSLESLVSRARPPIILEVLPQHTAQATRQKNTQLMEIFARWNYRLLRVRKDATDRRVVGVEEIADIGPNTDRQGWDYLVIPAETCDAVRAAVAHAVRGSGA